MKTPRFSISPRFAASPRAPLLPRLLSGTDSPRTPGRSSAGYSTSSWAWLAFLLLAATAFVLWVNEPLLVHRQPASLLLASGGIQSLLDDGFERPDGTSQDHHVNNLPSISPKRAVDLGLHVTPSLQLQRSLAAVDTELWVDESRDVGACIGDATLLPHMGPEACWSLHCLWSHRIEANIDMWFNALSKLEPNVLPSRCPDAAGGQVPHTGQSLPEVAIVLAAAGDQETAAQSLLEAFRVAREIASAEFIVLCRASDTNAGLLHEVASRIQLFFGTAVQFVQLPGVDADNRVDLQQALDAATAQHVLLLQAGVLLTRGSLSTLLETLNAEEDAAMVGPLLVSGRDNAAHAGGLLSSDGTVTVRTHSGSAIPDHLLFRRSVDVLSMACIMGRRSVFMDILAQLDVQHPAAAVAAAFYTANAGLQAIYQPVAVARYALPVPPASAVFTAEDVGACSNDRVDQGGWVRFLSSFGPPGAMANNSGHEVSNRRGLWILGSSSIVGATFEISRRLHMMQAMLQAGYGVNLQPIGLLEEAPLQLARFFGVHVLPSEQANALQLQQHGQCKYALLVVTASSLQSATTVWQSDCPGAPVVLDVQDLQFVREAREALSMRDMRLWDFQSLAKERLYSWMNAPVAHNTKAMMEREMQMVDASKVVVVAHQGQQAIIQHYRPTAVVHVVENMVTTASTAPGCETRHGLLFTSSLDSRSSQLAVDWLIAMLVPRILALLPIRLHDTFMVHIAGDVSIAPKAEQFARVLHRIFVHKNLEPAELQLLYNNVKVVAAPFASGSFQLDVLQGMAMHVPIVATPVAVEGLQLVSDQHCMVGDSFDKFAQHIVDLYTNCDLWNQMAMHASQRMGMNNHIATAQQQWLHVLDTVGLETMPTRNNKLVFGSDT